MLVFTDMPCNPEKEARDWLLLQTFSHLLAVRGQNVHVDAAVDVTVGVVGLWGAQRQAIWTKGRGGAKIHASQKTRVGVVLGASTRLCLRSSLCSIPRHAHVPTPDTALTVPFRIGASPGGQYCWAEQYTSLLKDLMEPW